MQRWRIGTMPGFDTADCGLPVPKLGRGFMGHTRL